MTCSVSILEQLPSWSVNDIWSFPPSAAAPTGVNPYITGTGLMRSAMNHPAAGPRWFFTHFILRRAGKRWNSGAALVKNHDRHDGPISLIGSRHAANTGGGRT